MRYKYVEVHCDKCGRREHDVPPMKRLIKTLREKGWKIGKKDLCFVCSE